MRGSRGSASRWRRVVRGVIAGSVALVVPVACGGDAPAGTAAGSDAAGPGGGSTTTGAPATTALVTVPANGVVVDVQALDNTFRVQDLSVEAGTEVRWTNVGRNDHNVVAIATKAVDVWGVEDVDFQPGEVYSHVFDHPGVFEYVCTIHGVAGRGMIGTVTVTVTG